MSINMFLTKPMTRCARVIEEKCGRVKKSDVVPMYKNILDGSNFTRKYPVSDGLTQIGTKLSRKNIRILEYIINNDRLFNNKYVKLNLTEILNFSNQQNGEKLVKTLLTPETLDKINLQRIKISKNPRYYVKDKTNTQYLNTPAGLNSLFKDINILKAAYALDSKGLDELFRHDITEPKARKILETFGKMSLEELTQYKTKTLS